MSDDLDTLRSWLEENKRRHRRQSFTTWMGVILLVTATAVTLSLTVAHLTLSFILF